MQWLNIIIQIGLEKASIQAAIGLNNAALLNMYSLESTLPSSSEIVADFLNKVGEETLYEALPVFLGYSMWGWQRSLLDKRCAKGVI